MLLAKKCQYFLYLNLIKISLEIVLSDFAEKKETFFDLKKQHFSKSKKSHFLKGINPCFKKMPFSSLLRFDQKRVEIMLRTFAKKKETFLTIKNNFSKSKKSYFSKGLTHVFKHKMPIIFFIYH